MVRILKDTLAMKEIKNIFFLSGYETTSAFELNDGLYHKLLRVRQDLFLFMLNFFTVSVL